MPFVPPAYVVTLPAGRVDGRAILGASPASVERSLGRPLRVERFRVRRDLVYRGLEVITDGRCAWAILVTAPSARVTGLGRPLVVPPRTLELRLRRSGLREGRRYRCDASGCFGTFFAAGGRRRVIYGINGGHRYLGVQIWPNP